MSLLASLFSALSLLAPAAAAPRTLVAAGDIASCASPHDEATAALVARMPGTVAVLGDAVYEHGTEAEFAECYSWREFRRRTRAALGNHEYGTPGAAPARAYFGLPPRGYYSYDLGAWHVVVINSNCTPAGGCSAGSPQERWLRADLARSGARCTVAYWHHARYTSGIHGPDRTMAPIWRALADAREGDAGRQGGVRAGARAPASVTDILPLAPPASMMARVPTPGRELRFEG